MKNTLLILSILLIGLASCKKQGCTDPLAENYDDKAQEDNGSCTYAVPTAAAPEPILPAYTGEYGALVGIKTVTSTTTPVGTFDTELGTAVAVFSQNGGTSFQTAGTISVATGTTNTLTLSSNNAYVYIPTVTDITGIDFSGSQTWNGTGGTWPSFTATTNQGFATVGTITSGEVFLSATYNLTSSGVTDADSIYYAVYGPSGSKVILEAGTTSSHTFSVADLSTLGTGSGFIQITAIKYESQTIGGRPYYIINETVRTKQVNINQ